MNDSAKNRLAAASRHLLKPLMRILLRNGVSYSEFSEWAKLATVESCHEQLIAAGKRPTDSQVAIQTGLTRKEIKRLRESLQTPEAQLQSTTTTKANRATRVLTGWHRDPDFCDEHGMPKPLALDDDGTFSALVKRYSGDMPMRAMAEELQRVGAVKLEKNQVIPLSRTYLPEVDDPQGIRLLGTAVHDLTATVGHNLDAERDSPIRFQRAAVNTQLNERVLPILRRMINEHATDLLTLIDDWMSDHELPPGADTSTAKANKPRRAGLGIYYFEDADTHNANDGTNDDIDHDNADDNADDNAHSGTGKKDTP